MVLVTGGTGLVGAHLLLKLTQSGEQIRATFRSGSNLERVRSLFLSGHPEGSELFKRVDWIEADLLNLPKLEEAFEGVRRVYHCAALISFDPRDFRKLKRINVRGTANVVNLCLAFKVEKLCYVSSIAAFSHNDGKTPINEESEWMGPANVYGLSKYLGEMEVWRGAQEGVPVVIVNPGVIIGPGFWGQGSGSIFRAAAKAPKFYPPGGTGFVTVNDTIDVMTRLMDSDIRNERYILVNRNLSFESLMHSLADGFQLKRPIKKLQNWQLEILWRLDWLRCVFSKKKRKLSRKQAKSLKHPVFYSNAKIRAALDYEFEELEQVITHCCQLYRSEAGITA
jgi:nucleoside-diphosphate-sugar epimerase